MHKIKHKEKKYKAKQSQEQTNVYNLISFSSKLFKLLSRLEMKD